MHCLPGQTVVNCVVFRDQLCGKCNLSYEMWNFPVFLAMGIWLHHKSCTSGRCSELVVVSKWWSASGGCSQRVAGEVSE